MSLYGHICGCYYTTLPPNAWAIPTRHYLPQVDVKAHTTVLSTTSRTKLTQKFVVPTKQRGIRKLQYTFPLFDGVTVVGFECRVRDRIITGEVQERAQAKKTYQEAVDRGEVAGLLEQLPDASDVFTTTIGNVPPDSVVYVDISYLGELKHDAEVDGVRLTIPTTIAPRYGSYPGQLAKSDSLGLMKGEFQFTVDTELEQGFFIRELRSPTHPIAVSLGTLSTAPNAEPSMNKASASLSLQSAELDRDFVIQIVSKEFGNPSAVLETHPTIPGSRALMTTLVPKFQLKQQKPEIVFICDRSGSMSGGKIKALSSALQIFVKSLPVGVAFNICSFGFQHKFLWGKSQSYSQETMEQAIKHVRQFEADFGGTDIFQPLQATLDQRHSDRNLEVFLVTDGEIWNQQSLFDLLNERIKVQKEPVRVFSLGIGDSVSHSLIEGVARAGNGFSQSVGEHEKLDAKVVRMLKAALVPHIKDYTIEIKYEKNSEDDFEIVEKVVDSLQTKLHIEEKRQEPAKAPISLFDNSANVDAPIDNTVDYPKVDVPRLLQAPQSIPPLFPFNRTTVYLLMSPESQHKTPISVILRGTCEQGPLELEIPIRMLGKPGETIHQLAAKKAILELEEGRGWLQEAKTEQGISLKEKHPSKFDEIVRHETVRLGVQFQVGGKNCSFVAVEKRDVSHSSDVDMEEDFEFLDEDFQGKSFKPGPPARNMGPYAMAARKSVAAADMSGPWVQNMRPFAMPSNASATSQPMGGLFGGGGMMNRMAVSTPLAAPPPPAYPQSYSRPQGSTMANPFGGPATYGGAYPQSVRGGGIMNRTVNSTPLAAPSSNSYARSRSRSPPQQPSVASTFGGPAMFGSAYGAPEAPLQQGAAPGGASGRAVSNVMLSAASSYDQVDEDCLEACCSEDESEEDMPEEAQDLAPVTLSEESAPYRNRDRNSNLASQPPLQALISLQTFEGFWHWKQDLFKIIAVDPASAEKVAANLSKNVLATVLAVCFLEQKLADEKDSWELIVDKARLWLENEIGSDAMQEAFKLANQLI